MSERRSQCCNGNMEPHRYGKNTPASITWVCLDCGEVYGAVMAARHFTLRQYARLHQAFVSATMPDTWRFIRYDRRNKCSVWKPIGKASGVMTFTDGWVFDWLKRRKDRKE